MSHEHLRRGPHARARSRARSSAAGCESLVVYGLDATRTTRAGTPTLARRRRRSTADDLRACAGARRRLARARARDAAAARSRRIRPLARRVSVRVRRDPRRSRGRVGRQSVRRTARRSGGPAARLRGAGAQPSAAPARGLSSRRAAAATRSPTLIVALGRAARGAAEERPTRLERARGRPSAAGRWRAIARRRALAMHRCRRTKRGASSRGTRRRRALARRTIDQLERRVTWRRVPRSALIGAAAMRCRVADIARRLRCSARPCAQRRRRPSRADRSRSTTSRT